MKRFFNTAVTTLLVLAVLFVGGISAAALLPIPGQIEVKIVQSGSMEPAIHTGGIVVIQPATSYAVGDIITFGKDTKTSVPTTHRIVNIRTDGNATYYTTKGDANEDPDTNETERGAVVGKVLFTVPFLGYLIDFARKPLGFALLVAVPAGLIVLHELWSIGEQLFGRRKRRNEDDEPRGGPPAGTRYAHMNESEIVLWRPMPLYDIFLPIVAKKPRVSPMRAAAGPTLFATLLLPIALTIATAGSTILYFSDAEASVGNIFAAGALDLELSLNPAGEATIGLGQGNGHKFSLTLSAPGQQIPFTYQIHTSTGGNAAFCNALQVSAGAPFPASGAFAGLTEGPSSNLTSWPVTLFVPADAVLVDDTQCEVTFTYDAVQEGGVPGFEYHDTEKVSIILTYIDTPEASLQVQSFLAPSSLETPPEEPSAEDTGTTTEDGTPPSDPPPADEPQEETLSSDIPQDPPQEEVVPQDPPVEETVVPVEDPAPEVGGTIEE